MANSDERDCLAETSGYLDILRKSETDGLGRISDWTNPQALVRGTCHLLQGLADAKRALDSRDVGDLLIASSRLIRAAELLEAGRSVE